MEIRDYIILLVGKSGTGKTTLVEKLIKDRSYKTVNSYTTRPQRYPGEPGHIFVSDERFDKLENICAYTEFDGYRYCATQEQVDNADIYVIDPDGVNYFKSQYKGDKEIITVELLAQRPVRYARMRSRGDSFFKTIRRLRNDKRKFGRFNSDVTINANLAIDDVFADFITSTTLMKAIKDMGQKIMEQA